MAAGRASWSRDEATGNVSERIPHRAWGDDKAVAMATASNQGGNQESDQALVGAGQ